MARAVNKTYSTRALQDIAQQFKILAEPTRLIVLELLAKTDLNVGALADAVGSSPPAVSHHLALLCVSKLVETNRAGRKITYALTDRGRAFLASAEKFLA